MAKTKQTIARFIDEYNAYLSSVQGSISRVEKERAQWVKEQKVLEETWSDTPVVANLVAQHPQEAWWAALETTDIPALQDIRQKAEKAVAKLVHSQQFAKDKIQECTQLNQDLGLKLKDADVAMGAADKIREAAAEAQDVATRARSDANDMWLDVRVKKWERQSVTARSPMDYDYAAPQPWWAQQWLLSVINPEMATNMKDAARFKDATGKNLYEVAQGYKQRLDTRNQAQEAYNTANRDAKRVEQAYNSLMDAKSNNQAELERSIGWVLPETGPTSLAAQSLHARTTAVENAARYCIMNNVESLGALRLVLPDAQEYAQRAGKIAAMQKVTESMKTATSHWQQGEKVVEAGLAELNKLARKHSRHTKIGLDTDKTQKMIRDIELASISTHARFKEARPIMRQSSPFVSNSFSSSRDTSSTSSSTTNSNDSMFWTMAWMYLLMSPNNAAADMGHNVPNTPDGAAVPLLDPQQFESEFQNANGGLGLTSDISFENLSDSMAGLSVDSGGNSDSFKVDIPSIDVDTSSGGSSGLGAFADYSAPSSSDSSYSSSSSSYSSSSGSSCSSSSGSSCSSSSGSSCGGGGD